jgi:hypothetical protein
VTLAFISATCSTTPGKQWRWQKGESGPIWTPTGNSISPLWACLKSLGRRQTAFPRSSAPASQGVPWPQIVGLRNRLIHGYDEVDFDILWQIVSRDLPKLIEVLEASR